MRFRQKLANFFTALTAARVLHAGVRVDTGRPYFENRSLDVLGCQAARENHRSIGDFHQAPAHAPVVRLAGGTRCAGVWIESVGDKSIEVRRSPTPAMRSDPL